ncbi:hypothetical protein [Natrinema versiforme]|nr:hypothetical protein [Natrinema versiforme]
MGKTITVSDHVYEMLSELKDEKDHQTFDSAIREVLRDADHEI